MNAYIYTQSRVRVSLETKQYCFEVSCSAPSLFEAVLGIPDSNSKQFFPKNGTAVLKGLAFTAVRLQQARNRLNKKKRALEVSAASYMVFLLAVCEFGHLYLAMVINLMALALGMLACGSGSAKVRYCRFGGTPPSSF